MALQKKIRFNGYDVEYWNISTFQYSKMDNITSCMVVGYKDKATRDESIEFAFPLARFNYSFEGRINEPEIYERVKQSVKVKRVIEPAIVEEKSATGEVLVEGKQEVFVMEETNPLVDAMDFEIN